MSQNDSEGLQSIFAYLRLPQSLLDHNFTHVPVHSFRRRSPHGNQSLDPRPTPPFRRFLHSKSSNSCIDYASYFLSSNQLLVDMSQILAFSYKAIGTVYPKYVTYGVSSLSQHESDGEGVSYVPVASKLGNLFSHRCRKGELRPTLVLHGHPEKVYQQVHSLPFPQHLVSARSRSR